VLALLTTGPPNILSSASSPNSRKAKFFEHHGTIAWSCSSADVEAFVYRSGMEIDADGAYRAYHPDNQLGLDSIEHAGAPGNWWALATDTGEPSGRPVIQKRNDPAPGYYVSMTSLYDSSIASERNPRRFVDAASVPYVVLPPEGFEHAKLGDFAIVMNLENGKVAAGIVADETAPELPMGEGSIALAKMLGIDSDPRTGGTDAGVAYVIYPGSGNGKPRRSGEIAKVSRIYFEKWGGLQKLHSCLK
jgi:hypothetical protein